MDSFIGSLVYVRIIAGTVFVSAPDVEQQLKHGRLIKHGLSININKVGGLLVKKKVRTNVIKTIGRTYRGGVEDLLLVSNSVFVPEEAIITLVKAIFNIVTLEVIKNGRDLWESYNLRTICNIGVYIRYSYLNQNCSKKSLFK